MSTPIASRRDFLKTSALTGTALVLGFSEASAHDSIESAAFASANHEITPFVMIDPSGAVTLTEPLAAPAGTVAVI